MLNCRLRNTGVQAIGFDKVYGTAYNKSALLCAYRSDAVLLSQRRI